MISIEQRRFLEPLIDWRILDMESLISFSSIRRKYVSVQKLLWRLHKKQFVDIYRDPWNKKNYIFLANDGIKELSPDLRPAINTGSLYHDSKVSALGLLLLKMDKVFKSIQLEHKIKKGKGVRGVQEFVPDARVTGVFKDAHFEAAVELELTQKEKSRIVEKAKYYLESQYYNHALYFFPTHELLKNYYSTLKEAFGVEFNKKIFLFSCPLLTQSRPSLENGQGYVMNKEKSFLELFGGA